MPRYRLKLRPTDRAEQEEVPWLEQGKSYHGLALLWEPRVRLFRPDGEGSVEIPREAVEKG